MIVQSYIADKYKPEATITLRIDNFADFSRGKELRYSEVEFVRGLPWLADICGP